MLKYDTKTVVSTGITGIVLGLLVIWLWKYLQQAIGWMVTPNVVEIASFITIISVVAMNYAKFGVIPINGVIRNSAYVISCLSFLVTLIREENTGAILLQIFLLYITAWGAVKAKITPITFHTNQRKFVHASLKLVVFLSGSLLCAKYWPVNSATQLVGEYWQWIALLGGIGNATSLFLLEMNFFKTIQQFSKCYICTCSVVLISYLGEYNYTGVVLHSSTWLIAFYVAFIETRLRSK